MGGALAWLVGLGAVVGLVLYFGVFDVWEVPTDDPILEASIAPLLHGGDVLLVARRGEVTLGNLGRCPDTQAPGRFVIARQIGEARERVDIVHEGVSIDGKRNPTPHVCMGGDAVVQDPETHADVTLHCANEKLGGWTYEIVDSPKETTPETHVTVGAGKVFMVSDNRHFHLDSRDYGEIPAGSCDHIVFRLWGKGGITDPAGRFSIIW